jgi:eukaryotic-like serine/threonine-protein kinase
VKREPLTRDLPDSFDALLRAAVDISDVPLAPPALSSLSAGVTLGGGRYRIERLIGRGGMGAVYEAEDRDTRGRVALKVLARVEPKGIKRFKDEFRSLADTVHPHLVRLRDLFMEDGLWFFTMDLIEGSTLSAHLSTVGGVGSVERELELRRLFSQLIDGVAAIHATGHLHRDLKPANVLVSREGSVVIVDFGLVGDFASAGASEGALPVVGTASHMAPEQARGEPAMAASDWYAVGTIVYEALTGCIPIEGDSAEVLRRKRRAEVPRLFGDGGPWPEDLVELCRALLAPEPAERPDHASLMRRLGTRQVARPIAGSETAFVGRQRELAVLDEALARAAKGALVVCRVSGVPGIGKTALVREFLQRAARERNAVVLSGRCYEREATPFKLLDGLVESLSEAIAQHAPGSRSALLPLAPLFLGLSLEAPGEPGGGPTLTEPEVRSRAVAAFRKGLKEFAAVGPVILHVDDVQWCDADGVVLLDEVLEAPVPPALLILAQRDEQASDALRALWRAGFSTGTPVVDVRLEGLSQGEIVAIADAMAGRDHTLDTGAIARESAGSPYFAAEMIRHTLERVKSRSRAESPTMAALTLGDTILSRYQNLPSPARSVLEALSVCDGPRSLRVLEAATGVGDVERAVAILRAASFVRTSRLRETPSIEPYHDRVREEIHRALSDARCRALHAGFARAFEALAPQACDQLLHHSEGAGDRGRAAVFAVRSAERAAHVQAFEHAASLYRRALRLGNWEAAEERRLHERLADALAMCGRNREAAEAYDRAASGAPGADGMRLEVLAATQLLCSGDANSGVARLTASIEYFGVQIPEESQLDATMVMTIIQGIGDAAGLVHREEASIDPDRLLRLDASWWAVKGLSSIYHPAGPFFASVHFVEAVRSGEPTRIARGAYGLAIPTSATRRDELVPVAEALMRIGDEAAAHAPSPNTRFWREYSLAMQCHFGFDVEGAAAHAAAAIEHASAGGHGLESELAFLSNLEALTMYDRFKHPKEFGRWEIWKRDALRRGDRNNAAFMRALDGEWWIKDTPELYRADMIALLAELDHYSGMNHLLVSVIHSVLAGAECYLGLTAEAFARTTRVIERLRISKYWFVPKTRCAFLMPYIASAIAHAEASGHPVPAEAVEVIDDLPVQARGVAGIFRAGIAHLGGDRTEALRLLERAESDPGQERTRLVLSGARFARGRLIGGPHGQALVQAERDLLRTLGCADFERLLDSFWPGLRAR